MSSKQSTATTLITALRKTCSRRRTTTKKPRLCKARNTTCFVNGGKQEKQKLVVSEKLKALKSLIPAKNEEMKADELFEETAEYIVLLRTQVELLQRLVDFYGSNDHNKVV